MVRMTGGGVTNKVGRVIKALSIFASTPDMEADAFMVRVMTGTLREIAAQSVEWGYDGFELLPNPQHVPEPADVERALLEAGACVTVINSGRVYAQGMALLHEDLDERRRAMLAYKRLIDLGAALGAPIGLGAARGAKDRCIAGPELNAVALGVFEELASYATSVGGLVMLEPADSDEVPSVPTVAEAVAWVERIDSPSLRIMLDTYQIATVEDSFEAAFAASKGLARHIHLYDPGRRPPGTSVAGEQLDWAGVARGLAASGFEGTGSVVLPEGDAAEAEDAARTSARFLRGLLVE
jgi:D-psicose/D-tagatose/L-ribulose 3-epimerase